MSPMKKTGDDLEAHVGEMEDALRNNNCSADTDSQEPIVAGKAGYYGADDCFRALIENVADAITIFGADGVVQYMSPAIERVMGYTPEELVGTNFIDYIHPDEVDRMAETFASFVNEPAIFDIQAWRFRHKDGSWRYIEGTAKNLLRDPAVNGIVANLRDVTERYTMQQALEESEGRYNAIFSNPLQMVYVHDEKGTFIDANKAALDRLGYTRADLKKLSFGDVCHPDDLAVAVQAAEDVKNRGWSEPIRVRLLTKSGEAIWVETCGFCIERDGDAYQSIGIARDITQQVETEAELGKRQRYFEQIIDLASDGVVVLKPDLTVGFASRRAQEISGYSPSQSNGVMGSDFVHPDDRERMAELFEFGLNHPGERAYGECRVRSADGTWQWWELTATNLVDTDVEGMVLNLRNITERKLAEEALRQREREYSTLVELSPDGIVVLKDEEIIFMNRRAAEIFGYPLDDCIGKNFAELMYANPPETLSESDLQALVSGLRTSAGNSPTHTVTIPIKTGRGEVRWIEINRSRVEYRGEQVRLRFIRDVTERIRSEEALRESEQKLKQIFDNASDEIIHVDTHGNIIDINWKCKDITGYEPEEVIGRNIADLDLFEPAELSKLIEELSKAGERRGKIKRVFETHIRHRFDGRHVPIEVSTNAIRAADGSVKGFVSIIRDITERKQSEAALWESEQKYRLLAENMHILVALLDAEGNYVYANSSHETITGYPPDSLMGRKVFEFVHREDRDRMVRACTFPEEQVDIFEARYECEDGFPKWCRFHISALYNDRGSVQQTLMVAIDITHSKRAEDALRASEEKLREIFENINDEILYLDKFGTIIEVNNRVQDILGFAAEEVIGKNFARLGVMTDKDLTSMRDLFERSMKGQGGKSLLQLDLIHKDGHLVPIEASVNVFKQEKRTEGIFAVIRDISERKQAEEQIKRKNEELLAIQEQQRQLLDALQDQNRTISAKQAELTQALDRAIRSEEEVRNKNEELMAIQKELREVNQHLEERVRDRTAEITKLLQQKEAFINQLAHDLRSPLTPLVALLPMMRDKQVDDKSREIADLAVRNIDYMEDLVGNTIKLAKLGADAKFDIGPVSPAEVVDGVINREEYQLSQHRVTTENTIDRAIVVSADKLRLTEVFENLAMNAIKFMPDGGHLRFGAEIEGDTVRMWVQDTGVGITAEQVEHIFEEFYKADQSRHDLGSSGLGLAICHRIIERHGGRIWAESEGAGRGTTFHFTLPLHKQDRTVAGCS